MTEKLKSCPFCGGEVEFVTDTTGYKAEYRMINFHIRCKDCKIEYPKRYEIGFHLDSHGEIAMDTDERQKALEAWNRRTCSCKNRER